MNQNTNTDNTAGAVAQKRLVRWEFRAEPGELFKWELCRTDGSSAATVWENGIWHTWDQNGVGGENSSQDCVSNAQIAAMLSAINQGFISANSEMTDA